MSDSAKTDTRGSQVPKLTAEEHEDLAKRSDEIAESPLGKPHAADWRQLAENHRIAAAEARAAPGGRVSDDLVRRAAALVEKQKAWDKWDNPRQPAPPAMVKGEVATLVSDMAAEITRLRTALATAQREGMEEAAQIAENEPEPEGEPPPELHGRPVKNIAIASVRATKRSIAAAIRAAARREGMEEAAQRLEELHKNHGYNSQTGEVWSLGKIETCPLTIDHSIGYYRAIAEGVAHILYAAKEDREP